MTAPDSFVRPASRRPPRSVTAYTVQYGRDGWAPGSLFVERNEAGELELTTPLQIIRVRHIDVLRLVTLLMGLFGIQSGAPSAGA